MQITRWAPFVEFDEIQQRLQRLLRDRTERGTTEAFADWMPSVDIQETEGEFLVKADLPEVHKDEVKVQFNDGVLTIEGDRRQDKEETGKRFHKIEREYGRFVRRFSLPTEIDPAAIRAEFKDGVLSIYLPKSPAAKPKVVDVKVA
jgi:HSP20 family protein